MWTEFCFTFEGVFSLSNRQQHPRGLGGGDNKMMRCHQDLFENSSLFMKADQVPGLGDSSSLRLKTPVKLSLEES